MKPKSPRISLKNSNENSAINSIPPLRISLEKRNVSSHIKHERNVKQGNITKTATPRIESEIDITIVKAAESRPRTKVQVDVNANNYYD